MKWLEVTVPFNNSNKELLLFNLLELGGNRRRKKL